MILLYQPQYSIGESMKQKTQNIKYGFTILEMIVSMGVFAIAVLIAVGSLLALTNAQKKALVFQSTQDNLRFALETMARDIRTGDNYSGGGSSIAFTSVSGPVTYRAKNGRIEKSNDGTNFQPLTSADVNIENLTFYVISNPHPRVTIVLKGVSGSGSTRSELNLQTTISQRKIQR